MYERIIKPLLFALPIERAQRTVLVALRMVGWIPGGHWLLDKCCAVKHPALEREVFGVRFPNPVGLAAGFDTSGEAFRECAALGFGFVEIGTVTPRPQEGNPRPRVFRLPKDRAIIHRIGLANRGLEPAIQHLRHRHAGVIVGCNIGKNVSTPDAEAPNDYLKSFRNLYQYADYFSVNIGCDNSGNPCANYTRERILAILEPLFDFRRGQNQYRPIMLKVSPDMSDEQIDRVTDILVETPLDGIVATDGSHRREGLRTSRTSLDKIGSGRLCGAPLTQRSIEIVRRIHERSGGTYPIIGAGGMMSPDDVRAMLAAGADLVQVFTGFVYRGPALVKDICRALIDDAARQTPPAETGAENHDTPEESAVETPCSTTPDCDTPQTSNSTPPAGDTPQTSDSTPPAGDTSAT